MTTLPEAGQGSRFARCPCCAGLTLGAAARLRMRTVTCRACGARYRRTRINFLRLLMAFVEQAGLYYAVYHAFMLHAWWPLWVFAGAFVVLIPVRLILNPLARIDAGKRAGTFA